MEVIYTSPLLVAVSTGSCLRCRAWSVSGGKRGKLRAACWKLATWCKLCNRAAECSWAFLRSSATLEDLWSPPPIDADAVVVVLDELEAASVPKGSRDGRDEIGFIGQQEHSPGKAEKTSIINILLPVVDTELSSSRIILDN